MVACRSGAVYYTPPGRSTLSVGTGLRVRLMAMTPVVGAKSSSAGAVVYHHTDGAEVVLPSSTAESAGRFGSVGICVAVPHLSKPVRVRYASGRTPARESPHRGSGEAGRGKFWR